MRIKNNLETEKKINFVIGLGRSGFWAAKFLKSLGNQVIVFESKRNKELLEKKKELEKLDILVFLDKSFLFEEISPWLKEIESVVVSPVISIDHSTCIKTRQK